eukprot:XP_011661957.1 PREDICTED: uncharacterized protein LOC105437253 [Strongylocentrotus purpuratus]
MNSTSYNTSLSSNSSGFEDFESVCEFSSQAMSIVVLNAIAIVPPSLTLIIILIHKKLRKQHNIIPFNIILCDFFVVALSAYLLASDSSAETSLFYKIVRTLLLPIDFSSLINILLAAVYQFINICVDPFGARHIITTPRIIGACILTWLLPLILIGPFNWRGLDQHLFSVFLGFEIGALLFTGLCCVFIYRAISIGPPGVAFSEERKRENETVFLTISLVYLTTLIPKSVHLLGLLLYIYYSALCGLIIMSSVAYKGGCVLNSLVYWWRLKEFRSLITQCRKNKVDLQ